ncbi:hypothetical protein PHYC_01361 [Phycisphaerales bacterium]|jgi:quercetin dioxygenase-like cupin family protein|nr:hypothetical protein PHYC_01361 [Phycisphaerales bacterium]
MSDDRPRAAPAERFAAEHLAFDLHAEAAALEAEQTSKQHGHRQKTLFKNSGRTVALFVLDAGASLAEHATSGIVTVQAIEGELDVTAGGTGGTGYHLRPGMLLVMAPGVRHDVRAASRAVFLLQVSLVPKAPTPPNP